MDRTVEPGLGRGTVWEDVKVRTWAGPDEGFTDVGDAPTTGPDAVESPTVPPGRYDSCSDDALSEAIGQIYSAEMVMRSELMALVSAYEARGSYLGDGARTMANWLVERLGLSHYGAVELARASGRMVHFPTLAQAIGSGVLSWDKAVAALDLADSTGADLVCTPWSRPDAHGPDGSPGDPADGSAGPDGLAGDPGDGSPGAGLAGPEAGAFDPAGWWFLGNYELDGLSAANLARLARRMRRIGASASMAAHRSRCRPGPGQCGHPCQ
ncbi:MAG: hypothetical protein ACYCZM_14400 [Acidimicrobiales bacterium]